MVKESAPLGKAIRLTEPDGVVLDAPPAYQQQITVRSLDAAVNLERLEARRGGNQRPRLPERLFKSRFLPGPNIQNTHLKYHFRSSWASQKDEIRSWRFPA
jgi:hypothetical protein